MARILAPADAEIADGKGRLGVRGFRWQGKRSQIRLVNFGKANPAKEIVEAFPVAALQASIRLLARRYDAAD